MSHIGPRGSGLEPFYKSICPSTDAPGFKLSEIPYPARDRGSGQVWRWPPGGNSPHGDKDAQGDARDHRRHRDRRLCGGHGARAAATGTDGGAHRGAGPDRHPAAPAAGAGADRAFGARSDPAECAQRSGAQCAHAWGRRRVGRLGRRIRWRLGGRHHVRRLGRRIRRRLHGLAVVGRRRWLVGRRWRFRRIGGRRFGLGPLGESRHGCARRRPNRPPIEGSRHAPRAGGTASSRRAAT
jgi:hypothetical protein